MERLGDIEELQKVCSLRATTKTLKASGIASVIFGIIALVIGINAVETDPINFVLVMLGGALLIEGAWLCFSPSPMGFVIDGLLLIALGIWNIFVTVENAAAADHGTPRLAFLGVMQIVWGFQRFAMYKKNADAQLDNTSPLYTGRADEILNSVNKGKPKNDPEMIQFTTANVVWKGRFFEDGIVLVAPGAQGCIVAPKEGTFFEVGKKAALSKSMKCTLQARGQRLDILMEPGYIHRLQTWLSGAPMPLDVQRY